MADAAPYPRLGGPVTDAERVTAALFAEALRDPERPHLDSDDVPEAIDHGDAYAVGMHLARLLSARP